MSTSDLMLRRTEIPYRALRLDQRITTIETHTTRYLIFRGQRVTVLPKDPRAGARGAHGQTYRILRCTVPEIGRRWDYTVDLDGQALRRTTQVVDAISQYEGDLAGVAVLDDDAAGIEIERRDVDVLWGIDSESLSTNVTVRITTSGHPDWAGTWLLRAREPGFIPRGKTEVSRTWHSLYLESHARRRDPLSLGCEDPPGSGIWRPVDDGRGLGDIDRIVIETIRRND